MKTANKTLLVTRPFPDNKATARLLQKAGFAVELLPLLEFKALEFDPPAPEEIAAIALTSSNALRALAQKDLLDDLRKIPLFAVGEKTAQRAKALGFDNVRAANGSLVSLAELIAAKHPDGPLFYPAARHLSGNLAAMLGEHEIIVKTIPVYQMKPLGELSEHQRTMLGDGLIDAGLFYSRRSAQTFIELCSFSGLNVLRLPLLCLSQNVADAFKDAGFTQIHISSAPNQTAMIALALSFAPINSK